MNDVARFWILIVLLAAGTWAMRSVPIMLHGTFTTPQWLERLLRHVPVAALTTLVVPAVLYAKGAHGAYAFTPERSVAGAVALLVAVRTKSMLATLGTGMAVLWVSKVASGLL